MEYLIYNESGIIGICGTIPTNGNFFIELNATNQAIYESCINAKIVNGKIVEGEVPLFFVDELSRADFFLSLYEKSGLKLETIKSRINDIPKELLDAQTKDIVLIRLENSSVFLRNDATLQQMAGILGINIDTIFTV